MMDEVPIPKEMMMFIDNVDRSLHDIIYPGYKKMFTTMYLRMQYDLYRFYGLDKEYVKNQIYIIMDMEKRSLTAIERSILDSYYGFYFYILENIHRLEPF